jgi:hypothetical protein
MSDHIGKNKTDYRSLIVYCFTSFNWKARNVKVIYCFIRQHIRFNCSQVPGFLTTYIRPVQLIKATNLENEVSDMELTEMY